MNLIVSLFKKFKVLFRKWTYKPEGYHEYMRALTHQDSTFDFYSNYFFVHYVLPRERMDPELFLLKRQFCMRALTPMNHKPIASLALPKHISCSPSSSYSPFRVNPSTGLPMVGAYDTRGNTFGFSNIFTSQNSACFNSFSSPPQWR